LVERLQVLSRVVGATREIREAFAQRLHGLLDLAHVLAQLDRGMKLLDDRSGQVAAFDVEAELRTTVEQLDRLPARLALLERERARLARLQRQRHEVRIAAI